MFFFKDHFIWLHCLQGPWGSVRCDLFVASHCNILNMSFGYFPFSKSSIFVFRKQYGPADGRTDRRTVRRTDGHDLRNEKAFDDFMRVWLSQWLDLDDLFPFFLFSCFFPFFDFKTFPFLWSYESGLKWIKQRKKIRVWVNQTWSSDHASP